MSKSSRRSKKTKDSHQQRDRALGGRSRARFLNSRPLLFRLAAILLGCLVILVIAEISLRVVGYEPVSDRGIHVLLSVDDPLLKYHCFPTNLNDDFSPLPDTKQGRWQLFHSNSTKPVPLDRLDETPWCVEYRLSSMELRDRELPGYWPPEGQARIACVGDSYAFGQGVPLEKTLHRQLERELGSGIQVVSVAQIAWDLQEEIKRLVGFRKKKHCSRALFIFLVNDLFLSKELKDRHAAIFALMSDRDSAIERYRSGAWQLGPAKVCQWIHSHLYDRRISDQTISWYRDCFDSEQNAIGLDLLAKQLRQLANLKNCQVAMVLYPLMKGLENDYPLAAAHQVVADMATEAGLPVLDLTPAFTGQVTSSLWVDPADQHPNSKAHAIAAKAIAAWLAEERPEFLEPENRY